MQLRGFLLRRAHENVLLAVARRVYRRIFKWAPQHLVRVDALGIPLVYYKEVGGKRNPVTICNYALGYYEARNRYAFSNCVDWLVKNLCAKRCFSVWEYTFPWKMYNLAPPWVSSMAQGLAIKVFVLAYRQNGDRKLIEMAFEALRSFTVSVDEGGVLQVDERDGGYWYEEYASPSSIRSHVLNGHIFALEGVYELYRLTKENLAHKLFHAGINELKRHIHEYDSGSWTYYDRLKNRADWKYHNLHTKQMGYLHRITGDTVFRSYYEKWKGYAGKPFAQLLHE